MRRLFSLSLFHTVYLIIRKTGFLIAIAETRERSQFLFKWFFAAAGFLGLLILLWLAQETKRRKLEGELVSPLSNQAINEG